MNLIPYIANVDTIGRVERTWVKWVKYFLLPSFEYVNTKKNRKPFWILGVHFLYNTNLEQDKIFFEHIVKIENILKL